MDDVPVERVRECQAKLTDFLTARKAELLARIGREKKLDDALTAELKGAAEQFKQGWK
jgi:F-type H+-transporting ATPase subunit alpha